MSSPPSETNSRTSAVNFSGKSGEYFKLWIVNLSLTILTLGIYSAWAKVRNTQYIYGHLRIEGHRFRYLATPLQILKGRIIAFVIYFALVTLSALHPIAGLVTGLLIVIAAPWLIVRGLSFSMSMTAYRNVRFSFAGTYLGALIHFLLLPILGIVTLLLAIPWVWKKIDQFIYGNIGYGGKKFALNTRSGVYYRVVGVQIVALLIGVGIGAAAVFCLVYIGYSEPSLIYILMSMAIIVLLIYLLRAIYQGMILNHIMRSLRIDGVVSFESNIRIGDFVWLMLSNGLLILLTLGLAYPVTVIRKTTFLAQAIQINIEPKADHLINTISGRESAFGEETADLFDLDLPLI